MPLFPPMVAFDGAGVVRSSSGQVFAVADTTYSTPLAITDVNDIPLAAVNITDLGTTVAFKTPEGYFEVMWKSGTLPALTLTSPEGARLAAERAQLAAEAAQFAAQAAAALAEAPADSVMAAALADEGSAARQQLDAILAELFDSAGTPGAGIDEAAIVQQINTLGSSIREALSAIFIDGDELYAHTSSPFAHSATSADTPGRIVARNSLGNAAMAQLTLSAVAPTAASHATRKDYVDAVVGQRVLGLDGPIRLRAAATSLPTADVQDGDIAFLLPS